MSQLTKTGIFAGAAVAAIALAVVASMGGRFGNTVDDAGAPLFPDFDPNLAQSMEIVKFDEDTGTRHEFKVALVTEESGRKPWVIASHSNYPADASTQLAGAASALVGKERGPQISSDRTQHGTYGVLDPTQEAKAGERGMGTLVVFAGENDKKLAELIVGTEIPDQPPQPDQTRLHYVRLRGQDPVYRVAIDAGKFSTKFEEWIERDLLKMQASRIKAITIRDLDIVGDRPVVRGQMDLTHDENAAENRWSLADLKPGEKLDEAKLNDLRTALADLKIVDVHKKPEALADLLTGKKERQRSPVEILRVQESLEKHGFIVLPEYGPVPSDGVVTAEMEDGLVYRLLFGGVASLTADQSEAGRKQADKKKSEGEKEGEKEDGAKTEGEKKDKAAGSNRYVFVEVMFNQELVKKPEIKPLPGESLLPAEEPAEKDKKEGDAKESKAKPAGKPKKAALGDSLKELRRLTDEGLIDDKEWESQRKQVERANQQSQEQYDSDLKAGRKKEKELNERFADWYYVIDDQVYKKIRLKRNEVVKAPEKAKDEKDVKSKDEQGKAAGAKAKALPLKTP